MELKDELHMLQREIEQSLMFKQKLTARFKTAEYLLKKHDIITAEDNRQVFVYRDGYYQNSATPMIESSTRELWSDHLTRQDIGEIINAQIIPQTYIQREELNKDINKTNLKNGVLDLLTGELTEHKKDYKFTFQLPITFKPESICPNIDQFLLDVLKDKKDVETIYELIAYCLYREYPAAKVFVLLGSGRNGKSTLIELMKAFLGADNIRNLSMHQLEHDTFAKSFLFGKHANMNPDVGNKRIFTSGAIKMLTGGDMIDTNVKHKDYMRFKNYAKLIFASNELPQSDDTSYAWMSRWIFIKFPHNFDGQKCQNCGITHDVDKELLKKLTSEEELSGLLNKVIIALKRIRENCWNFTLSDYVKNMEHEYARLSDPIKAFIEDCIEENSFEKTEKGEVYNSYCNYVHNLGDKPTSSNQFSQRFKQYLPNVQDTKSGSTRYWSGITIVPKDVQSELDLLDNPNGGLSPKSLKNESHYEGR